ncbi:MAG: hypothetical protein ISS70_22535 [Phycisphaerae bacterium]|nr:hypothetical protein [Phycisphaerae bacterium]
MGNYSQDSNVRLNHSIAKHYVGVRLQQGVPIIDADWNELEDLRRYESEGMGTWFIGNGVPVGSDGFRIAPIVGGGVNTILLASKSTEVGPSSIKIDLANSTAAAALGFDQRNAGSERFGSSPAQITSNKTEPFTLKDGDTLVVKAEEHPWETFAFSVADFSTTVGNDITATAAEVVAVITSPPLSQVTARAGTGNDFIIKSGSILAEGQLVLNDQKDLKYTDQPLYENDALASKWGVSRVDALGTPVNDEDYTVYLDVWYREVDSTEDPELVDDRIGVETAIRLKREWAVRVELETNYSNVDAAKPAGHVFYKLANLARKNNQPGIIGDMISDLRETDVSLRREIAYRGTGDAVLVDSEAFRDMLVRTRDNIRDFIDFLTVKFVDPDSAYVAGEVAGIDALSVIANLADHGIAMLNTKTVGTGNAFAFFEQLLGAEERFVNVWRTAVFPIEKQSVKVYQQRYEALVNDVESFLTGPAPPGYTTVKVALERKNLLEATRSQEQISSLFGQEVDRPTGVLYVMCLGSQTPQIVQNVPFDLRYEVSGTVDPDDDIVVEVSIDPAWQTELRNGDGSAPFAMRLGPGDDKEEFLLRIRPPAAAAAETTMSLRVSAQKNYGGLARNTPEKILRVGDSPPPSELDYRFIIQNANVPKVGNTYEVPTGSLAVLTFRLINDTSHDLNVHLSYATDPDPSAPWNISPAEANHVVDAGESEDLAYGFFAPGASGNTLVFRLFAEDVDNANNVVAEAQVTLISVAP